MNIKSLLLGSAVAAVAATGARAADAIVIAEPEPMEYVRICDTYGVGYFYIPGTETCMRIGGWVRYEIGTSDVLDGWSKLARGRLEINTRNESEWGTVAGYYRLDSRIINGQGRQGDRDNRWDAQYSLGIGGLEMGFRDSTWTRWFGYGGFTDWGGDYGFRENHYISYTFAADGFSGFVALDHDDTGDYMPDLSAGLGGTFGMFEALGTIGYDESAEEFALRGKLNADFGAFQARLAGFYASGPNVYWSYGASDWSVLLGLQASITEKTTAAVDLQYFDEGDWAVHGNLVHQIAPGLSALLEVRYYDYDAGGDSTAGFLRFQRSF
ncbi:porin [Mesorhizobium sp. CAU 1741]|uniref:porin n=1 Tax=Mesorhizobium sp. CAU 1741 TaxID=3140366 RepID=UPI00325C3103